MAIVSRTGEELNTPTPPKRKRERGTESTQLLEFDLLADRTSVDAFGTVELLELVRKLLQ